MSSPLGASVNTSEGNVLPELRIHASTSLLDVRTRSVAADILRTFGALRQNESVLEWFRILRASIRLWHMGFESIPEVLASARRIGRESGGWRREMVLEEQVVLVGHSSNNLDYRGFHEVVGIRAEAVDDVVVVPDVDLWYLTVRSS